jgi:ubiquitin-activating enzyme E1-like protein
MATPVGPGDSTVVFMRNKIRRLTASASEATLSTADIDQYLNNVLLNDFPYAIKLEQMRSVYTFFTQPYIDRYPLDVNFNQGVRAPIYVEGILGTLFKERSQFFNLWPRWPTMFQQGGGTTLAGTITGIEQPSNPAVITSDNHNLTTGAVITINNVGGMTQLNGNSYTVTVIDANDFSLVGVDNTLFGGYTGGGTWTSVSPTFSFVLPGPFLSKEVVIGGVDQDNDPISITDDGNGNLLLVSNNVNISPNPVVSVPTQNLNLPNPQLSVPGMYNINTSNPGLINPLNIGTVDYVGGTVDFTLPPGISLMGGTLFTVWIAQYQPGRPYCLLFWNNEFTVRPVPKLIHKIEVETFLTPVQFYESTDVPILSQWAQYLAYLAAQEILRDRQDIEGVQNLEEGRMRQEALVLERQGIEEIGTPNFTLFNSAQAYSVYGGYSSEGFP